MVSTGPTTYHQFWPYYLREHGRGLTRTLHYVGSTIAILSVIAAIVTLNPWFLLGAVIGGYLFAWIGHFFVEKNRPATFRYPLWSLVSDFRMYFMWLAGRLDAELKRCHAEENESEAVAAEAA
ncbi:MAG: Mpo1-like protein [Minwuia sp.]|uniref:Mpo1-like protein n=1 Tax=Minwuia sp. TaxID=2493630 RepID=UPI003A848D8E